MDQDKIISATRKVFHGSKIGLFVPFFEECFAMADLTTERRIAMFFAQVGHECQGFTVFEENLNYSAQGLANTWPSRYAVDPKVKVKVPNQLAIQIQHKPQVIANKTYSSRNGNGDEDSGDGWRYRGLGPMMITGKRNVSRTDDLLNMKGRLIIQPELLKDPDIGLASAAAFWKDNSLNVPSDKGSVIEARKKINGGLIGLDKVTVLYNELIKLLTLK